VTWNDTFPLASVRAAAIGTLLLGGCGGDSLRPEGDTCAATQECRAGLICRGDSAGTLRCAQPLAECAVCTRTEECQAPLVCNSFSDGSRRCGSGVGATTCRTQ
jgi:hypothetical protein